MDFNYIEKRLLKSKCPEDCNVYHNAAAEKILTKILTEQINREIKKNIMENLQKCCLDSPNGVSRGKIKMTKLNKSCKNKPKPRQKEYFGDMRMENGCDEKIVYVGNKKYKVHKTNDVPGDVIYSKWILPENVDTLTTNSNFNPLKTKYINKGINNTFYGDTLTNSKI